MPEKFFSESEATKIVQRAVQLQEQSQASTYTPGVTKEELARIASEVGVSVEFLEQAIRERGGKSERRGFSLSKDFQRVVDGEFDPKDFDVLISALGVQGRQYTTTQVGRSLHSHRMVGMCTAKVEVTARNGRTRITANASPILPAILSTELAVISVGIGASLAATGQSLIGGILLGIGGLVGSAWMLFGGTKAGYAKTEKLVNELAEVVEEENSRASANLNLNSAPAVTEPAEQQVNQQQS